MREAAELLKLEPYLDRTPLNLSGGQQQRTALARAIVKNADLVLLDEPLANLDYKLREELRDELPRIFAATGAIFVYATTEPPRRCCSAAIPATLSEGRVTQFGPTIEVFRQPGRPRHGADLLRSAAQHHCGATRTAAASRLARGGHAAGAGAFAALPDGRYTIGFQPTICRSEPAERRRGRARGQGRGHRDHRLGELRPSRCAATLRWVVLRARRARLEPGAGGRGLLDPRHLIVFDAAGRLARRRTARAA